LRLKKLDDIDNSLIIKINTHKTPAKQGSWTTLITLDWKTGPRRHPQSTAITVPSFIFGWSPPDYGKHVLASHREEAGRVEMLEFDAWLILEGYFVRHIRTPAALILVCWLSTTIKLVFRQKKRPGLAAS
jgi:hypothetical protein